MTAPFPANPQLVAGGGGLAALHVAIVARMTALAAQFPNLDTEDGTMQAPTVYDQQIPPRPKDGPPQFPCIIVRPRGGVDTEQSADENATATVDIIAGVWSDTADGFVDMLLLIDAIRGDLGEAPVLDGTPFEQTGPLTTEIPEEQPRPQWLGRVKTSWTIPRPRRVEARNPNPQE